METIPGVRVRGSLVKRLYHADWFVAVDLLIFHILMIPKVIPNVIVQLYVLPVIIFRRRFLLLSSICMASGLFSVAAPTLWNVLALDIRASSNVNIFKAKLKTYLFKYAYNL